MGTIIIRMMSRHCRGFGRMPGFFKRIDDTFPTPAAMPGAMYQYKMISHSEPPF
jgi:hypothetical protein